MTFDPQRALGPQEPAPGDGAERPLTVSQVTNLIKSTLEGRLPASLRVIGQVSNLRCQGHWYFSLRDERAVLSCVAWATTARDFGFVPSEGDEVIATGYVSHYPVQGRTQLYVRQLLPLGAGALELRFRALCEELRRAGYFEDGRKKPLPAFPRRIAVITSLGSAAIHDVISTAAQRCRAVGLLLVDVRVQGEGAAAALARAIRRVDAEAARLGVDAILVTRGGGSAEDLWTFNERAVADAAFECGLPLVAAIGHESDTTIIELVADRRAATPTQAVMHLVPSAAELGRQVAHLGGRLGLLLRRHVEGRRRAAETAGRELRRCVRAATAERAVRLERLAARLRQALPESAVAGPRQRLVVATERLGRALRARLDRRGDLAAAGRRLALAMSVWLGRAGERAEALRRQLQGLDPASVLARGYSYTTDASGRLVRSVRSVRPGQRIVTRVRDGSFESVVTPSGRGTPPGGATPAQMDLFGTAQ